MKDSLTMDRPAVLSWLGKQLTAREIQIARDAYVRGFLRVITSEPAVWGDDAAAARVIAADMYPLPLPKASENSIPLPGDVSLMPATRMYSEREVIYREREAFENGLIRGTAREFAGPGGGMPALKRAVAKAFPLPKVTQPRERTDSRGVTWRVLVHQFRDPVIEYRDEPRLGLIPPWREALSAGAGQPGLTVEVARIVTELAANPTEEVEAE